MGTYLIGSVGLLVIMIDEDDQAEWDFLEGWAVFGVLGMVQASSGADVLHCRISSYKYRCVR